MQYALVLTYECRWTDDVHYAMIGTATVVLDRYWHITFNGEREKQLGYSEDKLSYNLTSLKL